MDKMRRGWPNLKRARGLVSSAVAWPYVFLSLLLGFALPHIRQGPLSWANPLVRQDQVNTFLSSVSSGMMAFTGIVFSLLFIMLQFGSSAYSPHLVAMLSRNRTLTHAGGVFTGTFLYALMALREVGTLPGGRTPSLTLWVAFFWLLGSVVLLLRLVRVFAGLAITEVLEMLAENGTAAIARSYGPYAREPDDTQHELEPRPATQALVHVGRPMYLVGMNPAKLVALAGAVGGVVRVKTAVGDSVSPYTRVAVIEGGKSRVPDRHLWSAIYLARDRSEEQGPKPSIRLLVDIALRALSHGINDPTTAVRALDQIEGLLVDLGRSDLDIGRVRDSEGVLRLTFPAPTWEEYLDLSVTEIQFYGQNSLQVDRRLAALYAHLMRVVPEPRRAAVERHAARRLETVDRSSLSEEAWLRSMASGSDRQGLGHTFMDG
jgi:uncharacterized membrane protein